MLSQDSASASASATLPACRSAFADASAPPYLALASLRSTSPSRTCGIQCNMSSATSSSSSSSPWSPRSWMRFPYSQAPCYYNSTDATDSVDAVQAELADLPDLVTVQEVESLSRRMLDVFLGKLFVLQAGDCAEAFKYCNAVRLDNVAKQLLAMSKTLEEIAGTPVLTIARLAGQYAKPRSSNYEVMKDGTKIPAFRGEIINGLDPSVRKHSPDHMLSAYFRSAASLNYLRAEFKENIGKNFFISHEALLLEYETVLTRKRRSVDRFYNLGTHFPWVGERTRDTNGAHIEYVSGIGNSIAVKIGATASTDDLLLLLAKIDPNRTPGRVALIARIGASSINSTLPKLISAVQGIKHPVVWFCDPMHGNTITTAGGAKTRRLSDINFEISASFQLHESLGSRLAGLHLETAPESVTECIDAEITEAQITENYTSYCDPRLNPDQFSTVVRLVGLLLRRQNSKFNSH